MADENFFDDWGTGSDAATSSSGSSPTWWQSTLQHVVTAAADARYRMPNVGNNQQYMLTADGRLVPAGYSVGTVVGQQQQAMPQWAIFAALGLGALLLVKVLK